MNEMQGVEGKEHSKPKRKLWIRKASHCNHLHCKNKNSSFGNLQTNRNIKIRRQVINDKS